ncbi:hypothetical protein [Pseudomonas sp. PDM19]|uniref:hypothetical protein n=1 Tax=Pseudomonas sp. PDM19 TaxID=2769272 RepID=UPI001785FF3C|nr:hypothetical protein [Pseudomonas sp. PDM19]MBD9632283.1 hypothetical protein [Pseudomonas sp. PDM19]
MDFEGLQRLTPNFFLYTAIFFFSFLAPGFLFWYIHTPELFLKIEFSKLIALSIAITAPTFFVPFVITGVIYKILKERIPEQIEGYGEQVDWYVRHGWTNALNMYLLVAIFYLFKAQGNTILLTIFLVIIVNIAFEFLLMIGYIKNPKDSSSATTLRSDRNSR